MGSRILDTLSWAELYSLQIEIQARIRSFPQASGNGMPNQPYFLHGDGPPTQAFHFRSITNDGSIEDRLHHRQNLETLFQTQGQPSSSGPFDIQSIPTGLHLEALANQEIEQLGPGKSSEKPNSTHTYAF